MAVAVVHKTRNKMGIFYCIEILMFYKTDHESVQRVAIEVMVQEKRFQKKVFLLVRSIHLQNYFNTISMHV